MVTLACTETYVFDQAWIPAFAGMTQKDRDVSPQPENETLQPDSVPGVEDFFLAEFVVRGTRVLVVS